MPDWNPRADPTRYFPAGRRARYVRWAVAAAAVSAGVAVVAELFA
jgi:hypothetical protein